MTSYPCATSDKGVLWEYGTKVLFFLQKSAVFILNKVKNAIYGSFFCNNATSSPCFLCHHRSPKMTFCCQPDFANGKNAPKLNISTFASSVKSFNYLRNLNMNNHKTKKRLHRSSDSEFILQIRECRRKSGTFRVEKYRFSMRKVPLFPSKSGTLFF